MSTTTQVVFTTDPQLKQATMKKLKAEGSTLKSLMQYAMKAYVQGRISLGIVIDDAVRNDELEKEYQSAARDLEQGNNIVDRKDLTAKYAA
ncbi:MAG: hypothetical protein H6766_06285 [Candidatus Peribacteria bacterium]|nr:MAG: hypothetical protein H6766_06285 [Candidatus Peribacteria bacterium]